MIKIGLVDEGNTGPVNGYTESIDENHCYHS